MNARDAEMRAAREAANTRRQDRQHELLPPLPYFGDHLTPTILLSMNTGLRRDELLALRWECIDFKHLILAVGRGTAKNRQTRCVCLNEEATRVLTGWRDQAAGGVRVFETRTSFKTVWAPLLKRVQITKFRRHDLRHPSRLVRKGVPLNTVRELLGHSVNAASRRGDGEITQ